ncbi:unnamed protein product [Caenorhabditis auriculariae]|uniref:G protein-coupled receptor n=1 Tax=Caenorhabditis auriculariae TaxID=2777116 RepID=A0A8S1HB35_9PELO|nr:unnamed protein product [Caenorhabditis auriculariae]
MVFPWSARTTRPPCVPVSGDGHPMTSMTADVLLEMVCPSGRWSSTGAPRVSGNPRCYSCAPTLVCTSDDVSCLSMFAAAGLLFNIPALGYLVCASLILVPLLVAAAEASFSIAHTVYYKYRNALDFSKKQSFFSILGQTSITVLPLIALMITMTIGSSDIPAIRAETQSEHPEYLITEDTVLAGYSNMRDPVSVIALTIIGLVAYGTFLFTFICRKKIEKSFQEKSEHLSEHTKEHARTFIRTLTIQSLVPAIVNIPTITLFIYKQYTAP